jgi:hypothetical protein
MTDSSHIMTEALQNSLEKIAWQYEVKGQLIKVKVAMS